MKNSHINVTLGTICIGLFFLISIPSQASPIAGQGTWERTLEGRDLDGNPATYEAWYDKTLDITWLANANAANKRMTWVDANAWASGLNINGITGWRLPTLRPLNGMNFTIMASTDGTTELGTAKTTTDGSDGGWRDSSNTPVSELGHMFYVTLGNLGACDPTLPFCTLQPGSGLSNTGPFLNIQSNPYWYGTELDSISAWKLSFTLGDQDASPKSGSFFAWAVRDGDVLPPVVLVNIDIKPSSDPNSINLCSNGTIPIAIFGSDTFYVSDINTTTLRFADATVKMVGKKDPNTLCSYEDVNDDSINDLVCHFITKDIAAIDGESTSARLNGELYDGTAFEGTDNINIVKDSCI